MTPIVYNSEIQNLSGSNLLIDHSLEETIQILAIKASSILSFLLIPKKKCKNIKAQNSILEGEGT